MPEPAAVDTREDRTLSAPARTIAALDRGATITVYGTQYRVHRQYDSHGRDGHEWITEVYDPDGAMRLLVAYEDRVCFARTMGEVPDEAPELDTIRHDGEVLWEAADD